MLGAVEGRSTGAETGASGAGSSRCDSALMLSASAFMLSFFFLDLNRDDMLLVNDLRGVASPDELRGVAPPAIVVAL